MKRRRINECPIFTNIAIEIGAQCNRKCWFCPNAYNERPNAYLSNKLINKILSDLRRVNYNRRIILYIYNEPFLDERLLWIIKECRRIVPRSTIMIATNGDKVKSKDQFQDLFDAGLNQLQINVYSNEKRYLKLNDIIQKTTTKEGNVYINTSPRKQLYSIERKFGKNVTSEFLKIGKYQLSNRCGHIPSLPVPNEPLIKSCIRPFNSMQINWKGQAIICCNDYNAEVVYGDVSSNSIFDIWLSNKMMSIRKKLYHADRNINLCRTCDYRGGSYIHFILKNWEPILGNRN